MRNGNTLTSKRAGFGAAASTPRTGVSQSQGGRRKPFDSRMSSFSSAPTRQLGFWWPASPLSSPTPVGLEERGLRGGNRLGGGNS
jgi:hypothetical protein